MVVGIMQPYFFPYIGYFSLIDYSDKFIFFDTPQYIHHGWINRNRILSQNLEPTYIIVPIKKMPRETAICDIRIRNDIDWQNRIWGQLSFYKRKAPYYYSVIDFLHEILEQKEYETLSDLNIDTTIAVCKRIGIDTEFDVFSKMNTKICDVGAPDEWALEISKWLNAEVYVNPPGGQSFFDKNKYISNNIELQFLQTNLKNYIQRIGKFVPALSIIDVMMFCDDNEIRELIKDYTIL